MINNKINICEGLSLQQRKQLLIWTVKHLPLLEVKSAHRVWRYLQSLPEEDEEFKNRYLRWFFGEEEPEEEIEEVYEPLKEDVEGGLRYYG